MKTLVQKSMVILLLFIDTAIAQEINDLIPNDSISTESPEVYVIKTPTEQEEESPAWQSVFVAPMGPNLDYNSSEFQAERKKTLLKIMLDRKLLPRDVELEFFASRRSAQEDLEFYSLCLILHQRAIKEGKDVNFYLEEVKAERIELRKLQRDVAICGTGFEIFEGSGICNAFPTHEQAEQNYYACGETLNREINKYASCELSNFQIGVAFTNLQNQICENAGRMADGPNGRLWKPDADPDASCSGGTTILLDPSLSSVTKIQVLNSNKELVAIPEYFGFFEGGRPRFCIRGKAGAEFGPYSVYVKYRTPDVDKCFLVADPAKRED